MWVCAQSITNHASTPSRARLSALSTASSVGFIAQLNAKSTLITHFNNSLQCSAAECMAVTGHRRTPAAAASVSAESPASWICTVEHATGVPGTRTRHGRSERARAHRDASTSWWAAVPAGSAPQRTAVPRALRPARGKVRRLWVTRRVSASAQTVRQCIGWSLRNRCGPKGHYCAGCIHRD